MSVARAGAGGSPNSIQTGVVVPGDQYRIGSERPGDLGVEEPKGAIPQDQHALPGGEGSAFEALEAHRGWLGQAGRGRGDTFWNNVGVAGIDADKIGPGAGHSFASEMSPPTPTVEDTPAY